MKQFDKELLLKDLSARLPYGVLIYCHTLDTEERLFGINLLNVETEYTDASPVISVDEEGQEGCYSLEEIKPYLRPISSMTDAEKSELESFGFMYENGYITNEDADEYNDYRQHPYTWVDEVRCSEVMDFLNSHHFDCRGLIEKGLALEAPEGMYKFE